MSGGPLNVYQSKKVKFRKEIFQWNVPILGICFGHQVISKELGGRVKQAKQREFGFAKLISLSKSRLTKDFFNKKGSNSVWMSHADEVTKLAKGFKVIAKTETSKFSIVENSSKKIYGIQFHPEVTHTEKGKIILRNFVFEICMLKKNWSSSNKKKILIADKKSYEIRVICALSGGVYSSAYKLIHNAIGRKFTSSVNTGLLRKMRNSSY